MGKGGFYIAVLILPVLLFLTCKKQDKESIGERENHYPSIKSTEFSPTEPNARSNLMIRAQTEDSDGDVVKLSYRWLVNNGGLPNTGDSLPPGEFKKGDTVTVVVTPNDGKIDGEAVSVSVQIGNIAPEVRSVKFQPAVPTARDNIQAIAEAVDPDGDSVELKYAWTVDGRVLEGENANTLPGRYFKKGVEVVVEVIPSDDESTGVSLLSMALEIANTPPQITSSPPASLQAGMYVYQVKATDQDGDEVAFSVENAPSGMSIDPKSGLLRWQINPDQNGEFNFQVIATDSDGAKAIQAVTVGF
ncbi:MAG TPA: putative Ig domain-containing protein [bacterium]